MHPTVYLVDDDAPMRESIHLLLQSVGLPLRSYASAQEFLNQFDPESVGCLILDVRLPGMSGLELQQRLKEINADLPIILFSGHADVPMAVRGIQNGAIDFLEKPFNDQVLLDRIQQGVAEHVKRRHQRAAQQEILSRVETLTPREHEVMELLASGMSNKAIAAQLHISRKTLDIHRGKVLQKMQAETVADLVRLVLGTRHCCSYAG
jgi:FixJ family two-component response regulator